MSPSQSYKRRRVACQHFPDNQTLRLQTGAGEDNIIHLPSGLDLDCERQEEEELQGKNPLYWKNSPQRGGRIHDTTSSRTVSPTHYQWDILAPVAKRVHLLPLNVWSLTLGSSFLSISHSVFLPFVLVCFYCLSTFQPVHPHFPNNLFPPVSLPQVRIWLHVQMLQSHTHTQISPVQWPLKLLLWKEEEEGSASLLQVQMSESSGSKMKRWESARTEHCPVAIGNATDHHTEKMLHVNIKTKGRDTNDVKVAKAEWKSVRHYIPLCFHPYLCSWKPHTSPVGEPAHAVMHTIKMTRKAAIWDIWQSPHCIMNRL